MNSSRPFSLSVPRSFKSKQRINFVVILSFTNLILHTPPPALQYSYPSWEVVKVLLSEKKKIKNKRAEKTFALSFLTVSSALTWLSFRCLLQHTRHKHTHTQIQSVTHLLYLFLFWFCFCFCF